MKTIWKDTVCLWREMLDEAGAWPEGTLPKLACAVICAATVCIVAHYLPFTVEAFVAALLASGLLLLCFLVCIGIAAGVFATMYAIHEDRLSMQAVQWRKEQKVADENPESDSSPEAQSRLEEAGSEDRGVGLPGDSPDQELRCHDDP